MSETILKLKELKTKRPIEKDVQEYIIWQLSAMVNEELAETTARELLDGGFTLKGAADAIAKAANQRAISDEEGYRVVREYLHIDGVVTKVEAVLWFLRNLTKDENLELINKIKNDDPAVTKPMLDLDLDDLFG